LLHFGARFFTTLPFFPFYRGKSFARSTTEQTAALVFCTIIAHTLAKMQKWQKCKNGKNAKWRVLTKNSKLGKMNGLGGLEC
jgi:hypothetical protein